MTDLLFQSSQSLLQELFFIYHPRVPLWQGPHYLPLNLIVHLAGLWRQLGGVFWVFGFTGLAGVVSGKGG